MSSDDLLDDKNLKKLDNELQSLISRVGSDRKTESEVFDKSTISVLEKLISDRMINSLDFPISTGKEGNVFRATTPDNKYLVLKIYRTNTSTFKHISQYIIGDPRFKTMHNSRRDIVFAWTQKEFKNLERLKKAGVRAPKPIIFNKNVLVMQYIGDVNKPAPMLKDVILKNPDVIFKEVIDFISKMYTKAELVHADMSAFNILMYRNKPYVIDLGQGVLREHPNSDDFLKRDIHNIVSYFKKLNIRADENKIYNKIIKKL